ncbi:HD domain-containing protein [Streptococcus plurextorum]|uniref:HD domain-containing protein n=1 Tax=Streptococcus plurextorum TaxID=456876 RepID=UPI00041A100E|nr:HD domain-containing protein [Streptococcus plurextorum]
MTDEDILNHLEEHVASELAFEASGHDWWHIVRVRNLTTTIADKEKADLFICQAAALVHDLSDDKFNASAQAGLDKVALLLTEKGIDDRRKAHILEIISTMSFKGGNGKPMTTLEGQVVQDADRLDAIGAIGIARTMAFSGHKGRLIHDPKRQPRHHLTAEDYRKGDDTAIMHFYEKLLKLKNLMNTAYAKEIAEQRHSFMEAYLAEFYAEWDGIK